MLEQKYPHAFYNEEGPERSYGPALQRLRLGHPLVTAMRQLSHGERLVCQTREIEFVG
jgi:hypothetical protein